jgi:hypothetical protein
MTKLLLLLFLCAAIHITAQTYNGPESAVYDNANNRYFISNNGANQILARDSVGTLTIFTSNIASGPHGLEIVGNTLYACDGALMKGFDLTTAALVMNLNVGATFLNGICTDGSAYLYTTDFTAKKIFKIDIAAQTYTTFVTGLAKSPNGIIYDSANNRIVWVTWGASAPIMQALLSDSSVSQVTATTLGNCDGIVRDGSGNYYVSAWTTQSIYKFNNIFSAAPVAVVTGLSNPADIYYNLADDTLVCPNASNNTVTFHYMGPPPGQPLNDSIVVSVLAPPFNTSCPNACDAWAMVYPFGGTPPYHIQWATFPPDTLPMTDTLCGGFFYAVTITDSAGASVTDSVMIVDRPQPVAVIQTNDTSLVQPDTSGCSVTLAAYPVTPSYTGSWHIVSGCGIFAPDTLSAVVQVTNICSGTNVFVWTVGDTVCIAFDSIYINCSVNGINESKAPHSILVFPNPATDQLIIDHGEFKIERIGIYNLFGEKVYSQPQTSNLKQQTVDIRQLPSGIYFVRVKTDKGMSSAKFIKE